MSPRRRSDTTIDALLSQRERVATHAVLRDAGMAPSTISHRMRPRGPWQRILPGVVLAHRGTPTRRERTLAALAYVGAGAVVTGHAALQAYGVRAARRQSDIHVLQPAHRQRGSHGFVRTSRTHHPPVPLMRSGIPYASPARALVDACREMSDLDQVRELVAEVIQRRMCSVADLAEAVRSAARQRTALSRHVLAEIAVGVRSVAEAKAREIYRRAGVPEPLWNADLLTADGELIATPDGYWEAVAAALEIDSMEWHLGPAAYQRTQRRQRTLTNHGVLILPVAPSFVLDEPDQFLQSSRDLLREAARRVPPTGIVVRRAAAA
jgi:hypothetical protein